MKKTFCIFCFLIITGIVSAQVNGDLYTLQLGKTKCVFKYQVRSDTTFTDTDSLNSTNVLMQLNPVTLEEKFRFVKDTIVVRKSLTLLNTGTGSIHTRNAVRVDSAVSIDGAGSVINTRVSREYDAKYHVESRMNYRDFLALVKSGFQIKSTQTTFHARSFKLFYETTGTTGWIDVSFPIVNDEIDSTFNQLTRGGLILLTLYGTDHPQINISNDDSFFAMIHISSTQ